MSNPENPAVTYTLETIYGALGSRRRRLVLHHLRTEPRGVSDFEAVKRQIVEWESDSGFRDGPGCDERKVGATLHHVHLPKLEEYGIIEYDWRSKAIRYRPGDVLETHLDVAAEQDFDD